MKSNQTLAKLFRPTSYKLTLLAAKGDSDAEGLISVTGHKAGPPSRRLVFNQKNLKVTHAEIHAHTKKGDHDIDVSRINHHRTFEQVRLHADETLYPGDYTVTMTFIVKPPANSEKPQIIKAAFDGGEPIREFFPSIDEPEARPGVSLDIATE